MFEHLSAANEETNPVMNVANLESSGHILATRSVVTRKQRARSSLYPYKSTNLFGMD